MARHDDEGDEHPPSGAPLPPEDRLWRHPSELAGGAPTPSARIPAAPAPQRRPVLALAGACLTGAALTCGVLWLTRPGWVSEEPAAPARAAAVATTVAPAAASYVPASVPTTELADAMAPHLVPVESKVGDAWVTGSGLVVGDERVLVASPLAEGATFVAVTLADRRRVGASVVGTDPASGTTLLSLAAPPGAPARDDLLASAARSGQAVAVVGARSTAATGGERQRVVPASITAAGVRTEVGGQVLHDAIELDRALPDDALGAVVVDADGHLLAIVVDPSGDRGTAVAVPGRAVLLAAADLADDGEVERGWLGVEATDLDAATASLLGVEGGAVVTAVAAGSPASEAGLATGDVITEVDELAVRDASDLVLAIGSGAPGTDVEVRWYRGGDEQRATATLGG